MRAQRRYRFGPLESRGVVGPLRASQLAVVVVAALSALGALLALPNALGLLLGMLSLTVAGVSVLVPFEGRTIDQWLPVALRWGTRSGGQRRGFRSPVPARGFRVGQGEGPAPDAALPEELVDLEMLAVPYGSERVGIIRDRAAGTYTTAIAVRSGPFGLRDPSEQERKLEAWGGVLASLGRDGSPVRRLQWIERTSGGQGDELAGYLQARRDRNVALDSTLVRSYIELVESAAPATQEHEILLALQVDQRRCAREIRRLRGGEEGACEVLLREAEALAERLSTADLTVHGVLRPRRYAQLIRDAFDPYGRQGRARAALGDPQRAGVDPRLIGPLADSTGWGDYRTDSAVHATYWIAGWPRTEVGAAFLMPLLMQTTVLRTVGVTVEPIPNSIAMRRAEYLQTAEIAEEIQRERQGFMTTARVRRRQQAAARREEELADGHALMRFAGYITVSARDREQLDRSCSEVEHAAQLARLELQRLHGEQDAGFTFTLPLGRGLA